MYENEATKTWKLSHRQISSGERYFYHDGVSSKHAFRQQSIDVGFSLQIYKTKVEKIPQKRPMGKCQTFRGKPPNEVAATKMADTPVTL